MKQTRVADSNADIDETVSDNDMTGSVGVKDQQQVDDENDFDSQDELTQLINKISDGSIRSWYEANGLLHKSFGYRSGEKFKNVLSFLDLDDGKK